MRRTGVFLAVLSIAILLAGAAGAAGDVEVTWELLSVSAYQSGPAIALWRGWVELAQGFSTVYLTGVPTSVDMSSIEVQATEGECSIVSTRYVPAQGRIEVSLGKAAAGKVGLRLCYAFAGMTWNPSYSVWLDSTPDTAAFTGWRTISNATTVDIAPSTLHLVASPPNEIGAQPGFRGSTGLGQTAASIQLPGTFAAGSDTKAALVNLPSIPGKLVYVVDRIPVSSTEVTGKREERVAMLGLELTLPKDGHVAYPLPRGPIWAYSRLADGSTFLLGKDVRGPVNSAGHVLVLLGAAPSVRAEKWRTDQKKIGTSSWEEAYQVRLVNNSANAVDIIVVEEFPGDWTVLQSTPVYAVKASTGMAHFVLTLPAGGRTELLYRVRYTL